MKLLPSLVLGVWTLLSHSAAESAMHFVVDIISINGEEFVVKDENGKEANIHVGTETEKFGQLQVGDRVDAWVYPNGQARTLMILRSASVIKQDQSQQNQQEAQQKQQRAEAPQEVHPGEAVIK